MTPGLLETIKQWNGESVVTSYDRPTGSWMFIAMHDTRLGPATGGTRMKSYPTPLDGLVDAIRLAEGMTYKWAGVGMPYGGGKAVLAVPEGLDGDDRTGVLDRYAERLKSLRGSFQTGVDLGTTPDDMARIGAASGHAVGVVDGHPADPGPYTARGVFVGMRAALTHRFGDGDFAGRSVLVQGVGDVGLPLAELLSEAGAKLMLADIDESAVTSAAGRLRGAVVPVDELYAAEVDVYAPCAIGATLNPDTIPRLECAIVAGSANNQLLSAADADALHERGILYAPDYVINAGGAVAFALIHQGERDQDRLMREVEKIEGSLGEIFDEAQESGHSPLTAAQRRAERFLAGHA